MMRKFGLTVGIILMFLAVTIIGNPSLALAEKKFPSKPIYMVVGYKPGGGTDLPARGLASVAPEFLNNQPLIVVNKPGSSGMIASKFVANADPDGYTLLMGWGNTEYTFRRHLQKLPVDVLRITNRLSWSQHIPPALSYLRIRLSKIWMILLPMDERIPVS